MMRSNQTDIFHSPMSPHPPDELVRALKEVPRGSALEIGCDEGYRTLFVTIRGFPCKGIDDSQSAIEQAKKNAEEIGMHVEFTTEPVAEIKDRFQFVFEWKRERDPEAFIAKVAHLVEKEGFLLFLCESWEDKKLKGWTLHKKSRVVFEDLPSVLVFIQKD